MKRVSELIEDLHRRISNDGGFTLQAIMLKENSESAAAVKVVGECAIHRFALEKKGARLFAKGGEALRTETLIDALKGVKGKGLDQTLSVTLENEKTPYEVIGFGMARELKRYILFLTV